MSRESSPRTPVPPALEGNHSKVIRRRPDHTWEGIAAEAYKATSETWAGVTRWELCGKRGESPQFHVRYFEIAPGGYSTLEKHRHEHVVIPQRGRGEVQFGCLADYFDVIPEAQGVAESGAAGAGAGVARSASAPRSLRAPRSGGRTGFPRSRRARCRPGWILALERRPQARVR